jgi:hypothetical protein
MLGKENNLASAPVMAASAHWTNSVDVFGTLGLERFCKQIH